MDDDIDMAILVSGQVVAWFRDFDEAARNWCAENYFGKVLNNFIKT